MYWDRVMRDLETGRTTRQKLRSEKGYGSAPVGGGGKEIETPRMRRVREKAEADAAAGKTEENKAPEKKGPDVEKLFNEFVEARKSAGLPVQGLNQEVFGKTLDKQKLVHTARPGISDVEFSIKVKEDRVVVVARPVKNEDSAQ